MTQKPTAQSNHERLEKLKHDFAPNIIKRIKTLESLLGGIGEWAEQIKPDIEQMKQALYVSTCDRADAISLELAELRGKRQDDGAQWRELAEDKAGLAVELSTIKQAIDDIEAPTRLNLSMERTEDGKKFLYPNDGMRNDAMIVALKKNDNYHVLIKRKREIEREIGQSRAIMESLDREAKEYGWAVDVLTARLNNLTARVA